MTPGGTPALRDKRKPGHCWQDNELYDVFQPVIGALATHIFASMTRWAFGHRVEMSVREIAAESGTSKSEAARAVIAMERLGMMRRAPGRGPRPGGYDLLDLKEAARCLGAEWLPSRASWALTPARVMELRRELASVPVGDTSGCGKAPDCVPVGDAAGTQVSHQEGICVPPVGHPTFYRQDTKLQDSHPLPPPQAEGEEKPDSDSGQEGGDGASAKPEGEHHGEGSACSDPCVGVVMRECGFTRRRLGRIIAEQLRQAVDGGDDVQAAARRMIERWKELQRDRWRLQLRWAGMAAQEFFGEGHWRMHPSHWPLQPAEAEAERRAAIVRVGMPQ